jgi:AraC-like DNA-binding protein
MNPPSSTPVRSMAATVGHLNPEREPINAVLEPHFAPAEIAERLHLSEQTVIRIFQDQPGVFKLRRGLGKKRDYVTLRIPESVLRKVIEGRSR